MCPDINVWVALTHGGHVHHQVAHDWFTSLEDDATMVFCRFTQMGLLRLLTAEAVMGDEVLTQVAAWSVYDRWQGDDRVTFIAEPPAVEQAFRVRSRQRQASPKAWADAYLMAFAERAGLSLVTFDRALRGRGSSVQVLDTVD